MALNSWRRGAAHAVLALAALWGGAPAGAAPAAAEQQALRVTAPSAAPAVLEGYRKLFRVLDKGETLDGVLRRDLWPRDDHLASFLEYELLFHPGYEATLPRLREFLSRWPDHALWEKVAKVMDQRVTESGPDVEALAWYDKRKPRFSAGRIRHLDLLLQAGRLEEAKPLFQEHYRQGGVITKHLKEALLVRFPELMTAADDETRAKALLDQNNGQDLLLFLPLLPAERQSYYRAVLAARQGSAQFDELVKRLPPELAQDPELWRSRVDHLRSHGRRLAAMDLLNGEQGQWLKEEDRWTQRYRLGREFLYVDQDYASASALLDRNAQEAGGKREDSLWLAGWSAYLAGQQGKALELFMRLGREGENPAVRSQGAYWAAHELRAGGGDPTPWLQEAARHPDSFYGLLGAEEAGVELPPEDAVVKECPLALEQLAADEGSAKVMAEMRSLQAIDRSYHNGAVIRQLAAKRGLALATQLCLAITYDAPHQAVEMAKTLRKEDKVSWLGLFPVPGWQPAVGWVLDPAVVWGLVRQESLFQPGVKSSAGAVGLMQLMPATAKLEAKRGGYAHPSPYRMRLPGFNLTLGQQHLLHLLKVYDGDMVLSLIAYNAGPGRANRWKEERYRQSPVSFIERIPIAETRGYVPKVMMGIAAYRLSHGEKSNLKEMLKVGGSKVADFLKPARP